LSVSPTLLRRRRRRLFRRLVFVGALISLVFVSSATAVPPTITVTITGTLGSNGWYRSNVVVKWDVQGATSSTGCDTRSVTVDTPGEKITCSARNDNDMTEAIQSVTIKLDKTAPAANTVLERMPDANGWYNRPLTVAFAGVDVTSGLAGCSSTRYSGPDNAAAFVSGSCSDHAGNVSALATSFKYDATAPTVAGANATLGNRSAQLSWRMSTDTTSVEIRRAPGRNGEGETVIYRGASTGYRDTGLTVGRKYEYRVTGVDEAANRSEHILKIVATGALLFPGPAAQVSLTAPPKLVWTPVKRTRYYNLQLIRGRKVLSAWPVRPGFQLRRTWFYNGRRYRLRPGVYRWYVWPGIGRISAARYGPLLGSSTFVVMK
jgi:hypothetical protein